jgi:hypothetical protein
MSLVSQGRFPRWSLPFVFSNGEIALCLPLAYYFVKFVFLVMWVYADN